MRRLTRCALVGLAVLAFAAPPARAQEAAADSVPADTARVRPPSPGGAFVRSLIVPGWGQAASGAYFRGGVYFAAQTGSWFMLVKTMARLGEARAVEKRRVEEVRRALLAAAAQDTLLMKRYAIPDSLAVDIDRDERVSKARGLVNARTQQREDWIAWTIFWTLASGVDALVSAHLADFPADVSAEPRPSGGASLKVSIPVGGKP
ncbi:MAG TPA: DUF5683 domain-containing protein [Longimicrobiales bacterium]|nr:DUF5683 domain-containing protein [Longimicrobiales bacterium]